VDRAGAVALDLLVVSAVGTLAAQAMASSASFIGANEGSPLVMIILLLCS
jgi:hypothetical protein